ncbi:unnamed protein product [Ilex paraguariensis]|uniref:ATP synthase subunit gamma, mitochondrial n=1 Tax=Ilex paraguariensis TaxID=185542 RepID=A0ABC8RW54_9AQUA
MKSVKNIQKIMKAMKMVAASKLRAIQTKAENSCGLWQPFTALLGDTPSFDIKKNVVVTISSGKGPEKLSKYVVLGEKAKAQLVRDSKKDIEISITELQKNPLNYTQASFLYLLPHIFVICYIRAAQCYYGIWGVLEVCSLITLVETLVTMEQP